MATDRELAGAFDREVDRVRWVAELTTLVDGWPEPFDLPFICHVWTATSAS